MSEQEPTLKAEIVNSQDPIDYHKKLIAARLKHANNIVTEYHSHAAIPVQAQPVNIPGFQQQAVQMTIQMSYITTIIYREQITVIN